ncbi:MAG: exodeoxyribonuclease VII large subunit [Pirellulaceae bacterium]
MSPLTVSQLTTQIKAVLEELFTDVWVAGEVSNVSRPRSGHVYFSLKDDAAQIRAAIWQSNARRMKFELKDGMEVLCRGGVDVYAPSGSYTLIVRQIEPRGEGALQAALRKLHEKLAAEGLFDPSRKRPLPRFPRKIAVVTSPSGAAVRDFLKVVRRRWRGVEVLIVPTRVQGDGAAREIAAAIKQVNRLAAPPDVLVVTRGGGSLEDLWSFNEEAVVRAICDSRVPVVSAVGHEVDVTLSDLAADFRAATPTEAAEHVVPSREDVLSGVASLRTRLDSSLRGIAARARGRLDALAQRRVLRRPEERIHDLSRRVDELAQRAERAIGRGLVRTEEQLGALSARLESLSPLGVLARGYSITQRADDGALLHDAADASPGEAIRTRLHRGEVVSRVESVREGENP